MLKNDKLNELILKIKNNDTKALSDLYDYTKKDVFAFVFSIVKHYHDAEDVMHDIYVTIYKNSVTYVNSNNPKSWIFTIAKNECLMKLRKRKNIEDITQEELNNISSEHKEFNKDDKILLEFLLNKLNEEERKIVVMYNINGFKHSEISLLLDIPVNTIISKYNRSIKKLNSIVKEEVK